MAPLDREIMAFSNRSPFKTGRPEKLARKRAKRREMGIVIAVGAPVASLDRQDGPTIRAPSGTGTMTRKANLYPDRIEFERYAPRESCELCRVDSPEQFLARLERGQLPSGPCVHWPEKRIAIFNRALLARDRLPAIPVLEVPRPVEPGLLDLNEPTTASPLLVTGNSELTQTVLLAVVSRASSPFRILFANTRGHTVDMAMIFGELTVDRVASGFESAGIDPAAPSRVVIPGLAREIATPLAERLGRAVETGPVCAAELPLYLGDDWQEAA